MPDRRQVIRALGATAATGLAGCVAAAPTAEFDGDPPTVSGLDEHAFTQFQGGLRNRGYTDTAVPAAVEVDWTLPVNRGDHSAAKSSPVRTPDGDVVIAGDTGVVRRVTPAGGVTWSTEVDATTRGVHGTPAIANGTVYVGAYDGALYAFDLADGTPQWRTALGDAIGSSPVYRDGIVYIAVEYHDPSGAIAAVHAGTGESLGGDGWPTDQPHSTIAIDHETDRLAVGANDGVCYGWTMPDLDRAWSFPTDRPVKGPIAVHDGTAIFGSWDGHVYGVALDDGTERWSVSTGAEVMSGPAVRPDGVTYVGNHTGDVLALEAGTGEERWQATVRGAVVGSLRATPDHVLVGAYGGRLHALDAETGDQTWAAPAAGRVTSAPLVTPAAIYVAERRPSEDEPGNLYRLVPA